MENLKRKLIVIGTDRLLFINNSAVRNRQIEYSRDWNEVFIIVFSTKKFDPIKISENCTVYSTNSLTKFNYISSAIRIGKKIIKNIDEKQPILISCQDPFETALAGKSLINLRKNSELLLQIHTDLFSPYFVSKNIGYKNAFLNKIRLFISKFTLPHAETIRVVSSKIAESLIEKGIDKSKIIVKPIEVKTDIIKNSTPAFNLKEKYPQFKKVVLMVSRLETEKNIEMAINAWRLVIDKNPDFGLIIVGSGRLTSKLKKMVYRLNLSEKVLFEGWKTDTVSYYKGSDALLVTSWYEGYGMVFKEAEAAGLKIVSTDVGIAKEIGARIVDWSPEKIAEGIIEVLK